MKINLTFCNDSSKGKMVKFILLFLVLSSIFSAHSSTVISGEKYYRTFYVGEDGIQYFIEPFLLKSEKSKAQLLVDFTFRFKNEIKDSVILNFSIKSSVTYKTIDSLNLSNENIELKSSKIELLFFENRRSNYISRFTTKVSLKDMKELFNNDNWIIAVTTQNQITRYSSHGKSNKEINSLKANLFTLF